MVTGVCVGRIKELMSAPVECYRELEEFLTPYEELRWLHEVHTRQYHLAYSSLTAACAANSAQQSLAKQKVWLYGQWLKEAYLYCCHW